MELLLEDDAPEIDGSKIGVRKILVKIDWGIKGFYIIDFLPEGESFNIPYHTFFFFINIKWKDYFLSLSL